jgi:hypothetical protein
LLKVLDPEAHKIPLLVLSMDEPQLQKSLHLPIGHFYLFYCSVGKMAMISTDSNPTRTRPIRLRKLATKKVK